MLASISGLPVHSGTVTYDESISGDVDGFNPFYLDFGLNTFMGSVSIGEGLSGYDNIVFVLPSGSQAYFSFDMEPILDATFPLVGIFSWHLEELNTPQDNPCNFFCDSEVFAGQQFNHTSIADIANTTYNFENIPALTHDVYALQTSLSIGSGSLILERSYFAQIDVQPVPLPPTFVFMLSGLMFLFHISKKSITRQCNG